MLATHNHYLIKKLRALSLPRLKLHRYDMDTATEANSKEGKTIPQRVQGVKGPWKGAHALDPPPDLHRCRPPTALLLHEGLAAAPDSAPLLPLHCCVLAHRWL